MCVTCGAVDNLSKYLRDENSPYYGKYLCKKHYAQVSRYGEVRKTTKDKNIFIINGDLAEIIVKDKYMNEVARAKIDENKVNECKNHKWRYNRSAGYVVTNIEGKQKPLHKFLTKTSSDEIVDHRDRDKMNNIMSNLVIANKAINAINKGRQSNNTSGFVGVTYEKRRGLWLSRITVDKKTIYLGYSQSKYDAVVTRLEAELKYFGESIAPQRHLFDEYGIKVGAVNV